MHFGDYQLLRNRWKHYHHEYGESKMHCYERWVSWAQKATPEQFRLGVWKDCDEVWKIAKSRPSELAVGATPELFAITRNEAYAEQKWVEVNRPYYNIWPIAFSLAEDLKYDMPMKALTIPVSPLLLRYPSDDPSGISHVMVTWSREDRWFGLYVYSRGSSITPPNLFSPPSYEDEETFGEFLERTQSVNRNRGHNASYSANKVGFAGSTDISDEELVSLFGPALRMTVFVSLLASGTDLITPVVLAKDQSRYDSTADDVVKQHLEDRAVRRCGKGFEVCRKLQVQKEQSPHWRNPHLATFWVGPGRTKAVVKLRSGSVVQRVSMAEVPTGYLGPESSADEIVLHVRPSRSLSVSVRFEVLKRDDYRCRLCGRSAKDDSVKLEVDHIRPVNPKPGEHGGGNARDNLWTLCEDCNRGKSNDQL